jgi:hypothetical protein
MDFDSVLATMFEAACRKNQARLDELTHGTPEWDTLVEGIWEGVRFVLESMVERTPVAA